MITCLGLVVGLVESDVRQDVLNQCAEFLSTHKYLIDCQPSFEIDGKIYATAVDTHEQNNGEFWVLFNMYDGFLGGGIATN